MLKSNSVFFAVTTWLLLSPAFSWGQQPPNTQNDVVAQESPARDEILQSASWRQLQRSFDQWLSVQKIYTADQVASLKAGLRTRVETMSARELEDFIYDTEERLAVLMSDEAMDARSYLSYFTEAARKQRVAPEGEVPNAWDISVSQLRQELREFQRRRAGRSSAQTQFNRLQTQRATRAAQGQRDRLAQQERDMRETRSQQVSRQQQLNQSMISRSRYAPRQQTLPSVRESLHVSPWGGIWRSLP